MITSLSLEDTKPTPCIFQQFPNHGSVGQVPVVGHRYGAQLKAAYEGLGIFDGAGPGGGVADVAYGQGSRELGQG